MGLFDKLFGINQVQKNFSQNLLETLPILRIEDDKIILKDGRVAVGYEYVGAPFEAMQGEDYEGFARNFELACLALPNDYIVQKIDVYTNVRYPYGRDESKYDNKGFFEKETIKYYAERNVLRQISYIFIISNTNNNSKNTTITNSVSRGSKLYNTNFKGLEERLLKINTHAKSFIDSLASTNWANFKELKDDSIEKLYYQFLNMDFTNEVKSPVKEILNHYNALSIGEKRLNIVSLQEQAEEIYTSISNEYNIDSCYTWRLGLHLQFPHITVSHFYIEDSKQSIKGLENKKLLASSSGVLGGEEAKQKVLQLEQYISQAISEQSRFISINLQVIIPTLSELAREKNVQQTCDAFRATYGMIPLVETYDGIGNFFACLPGSSSYSNRWLLCKSEHASCYVNPMMEFSSKKQGDFVADRYRNLIYIDVFNRDLNNQNAIIIGPPGSGKSFTMGHFIVQRYERKERQIGIDVGGTYKNIFDALGAGDKNSDVKYFEYSSENPISFNPFLCDVTEDYEYIISDDKVSFIITLFNIIKNTGRGTWSNEEWSVLQFIIPEFYKYLQAIAKDRKKIVMPKLSLFYEWLNNYVETKREDQAFKKRADRFDFDGMLMVLETFVVGKYSYLLNSDDTLDISDYNLVCFDMAKIKDDEKLYPLVSLLLIELTLDVIRKYPEDKKHFFMDEAWSMLSDTMGEFVEYLYRTIRKCNGGMNIITQGVDELNTNIGAVIKNNAETKIILNHTNEAAIRKVGQHLGFTESEIRLIMSLRKNPDCREVFIKQGSYAFVFVLEVPDFEHAILTSNPVERNHLNNLKKLYNITEKGEYIGNNMSTQYAIAQWREDKENGYFKNK